MEQSEQLLVFALKFYFLVEACYPLRTTVSLRNEIQYEVLNECSLELGVVFFPGWRATGENQSLPGKYLTVLRL